MKVKFAILGCGHIGKRHAELVATHPDAELIATIDPLAADSLQLTGFNVPHFNKLEDFLSASLTVDVINICTPNGFHAQQAIACLQHGINVVIEKPIAISLADAKRILTVAGRHQRLAFPVVQNRYSAAINWLKQLVQQSRLGEIYMVQLNCFWNRDERYYTKNSWHGTLSLDGGPLYTQFSHFIDVLNWIFGDIEQIESRFSNFSHQHNTDFEDSGVVTFNLVNGGLGAISYSTCVFQANFESSITVVAANGTVKIGGQYMNSVDYCEIKGLAKPEFDTNEPVNHYGAYKGSASNHHLVLDNVIQVIKDGEAPHVALEEGVKVVDIIERIYASRSKNLTIANNIISEVI